MSRPGALLALAAIAVALAPRPAEARRGRSRTPRARVVLDGERVPVRWIDGDTFRILGGPHAGRSARLAGVNALETYGPVHRWAGMPAGALLAVAKASGPFAAASTWRCGAEARSDVYGRLLVECPDAAEALVERGFAMVFAIDAPPDAPQGAQGRSAASPPVKDLGRLLAAQRRAQAARAGMWAGGTPREVPTSLHSAGEADLGPRGAYDRIADTRTGVAAARPHARTYATCEEVCVGAGADLACMTYVPFERRYRQRPACIRPRRWGGP